MVAYLLPLLASTSYCLPPPPPPLLRGVLTTTMDKRRHQQALLAISFVYRNRTWNWFVLQLISCSLQMVFLPATYRGPHPPPPSSSAASSSLPWVMGRGRVCVDQCDCTVHGVNVFPRRMLTSGWWTLIKIGEEEHKEERTGKWPEQEPPGDCTLHVIHFFSVSFTRPRRRVPPKRRQQN